MNELAVALITGLAAGLHSATWGMFKDAPQEGFTWSTYVRSPIVASLIAIGVAQVATLDLSSPAGVSVLFGVTYGLERAILEIYKTFLRVEDQSKYTIPMQFSIRGEVVQNTALRLTAGAVYFSLELLILYGVYRLQTHGPDLHPLVVVLLVGSAGGWVSAFGGAWKDAPVEGFMILKFFRSPVVAFLYGLFIAYLTPSYPLILLGSIGYTVATLETHKTFFYPNEDRGKFQGQDRRYPDFLSTRLRFVPLYVAIWIGMVVTGVAGVLTSSGGLFAA